ncbi:MAG: hypothetical protein IPK54_11700 [Dokdonella sp.]|jgi:predicted outer membrane repeat protein|uniref:hypothetical protein n=1 Tax=Dokdonella sp. TaxID=2291710 RepID=UPI0025BF67F4|nr:hypothetical protein [Dokdonella sp.]MBK8124193.1 hypothetical protein [Dokdonella sp.]
MAANKNKHGRSAWLLACVMGVGAANAAVYTVGPTGTPGNCTHSTIQAAINAAAGNPGTDEIRISANQIWPAQALYVENHGVDLIGGFADCASEMPTAQTELSGAGGVSAPVVVVSNTDSHQVRLNRLAIVDGDPAFAMAGSRDGGGIRFLGPGGLELERVRIADNRASSGGGVFVQSYAAKAPMTLAIGDHVQIEDNQAVEGFGGGIRVVGANLALAGVETSIRRNSAGNNGGGISASSDWEASIVIASAGAEADGVIADNTSLVDGGGIHVWGSYVVRLYTDDPVRPLRLERNTARTGGAIFAERGANVLLWESIVSDNLSSGSGAALGLDGARIGSYRIPGAAHAPAGAVACAQPILCNLWENNISRADSGLPREGAIAKFVGNPSFSTELTLESASVRNNQGFNLFSDVCSAGGGQCAMDILLSNSELVGNSVQSLADLEYGSDLQLDLCTVAEIGAINAPMFNVGAGLLGLNRSIIWQPGRAIIGNSQILNTGHLLVHDTSQFPPDPGIRSADPRFIDPANGNWQLMPDSPALDSAPVFETPLQDLARAPRVVDLPQLTNLAGPVDLGAWERQEIDVIFIDGFDSLAN